MVSWISLLVSIVFPVEASEYYNYEAEDFFKLEEVNRAIDINQFDGNLLEAAVFHATNEARAKRRKNQLNYEAALASAAKSHSSYQAKYNKVEHINKKDRKFETPFKRVKAFGGDDFNGVAENLAKLSPALLGPNNTYFMKDGQPVDKAQNPLKMVSYKDFAQKVVNSWIKSRGHNRNLMGNYAFLGCGVSDVILNKDKIPQIFFTQNFGIK